MAIKEIDANHTVIDNWSDVGLPNRANGQTKSHCPKCGANRRSKDLSINYDQGVARCHRPACGQKYTIDRYGDKDRPAVTKTNLNDHFHSVKVKKEYKRPSWSGYVTPPQDALDLMQARGISKETLRRADVTFGRADWIAQEQSKHPSIRFNYFRPNGELINVKFRSAKKKAFGLFGGAELVFYNMKLAGLYKATQKKSNSKTRLYIVEGEPDALSFVESGFDNVVSVPNGVAIKPDGTAASLKMEYLDNDFDFINSFDEIVFAGDCDKPGLMLKEELIRRIGAEKMRYIEWNKGCKDGNEYLIKNGPEEFANFVNKIKAVPIKDVVLVDDVLDELELLRLGNLKPGDQIGDPKFDAHMSFEQARLSIITGISTHGKSEFLDYVLTKLSVQCKWKVAFFSPENFPVSYHIAKFVSKITGKKLTDLNQEEFNQAVQFVSDHFYWIYPKDDNFELDNILSITEQIIGRYGINAVVIDPYTELTVKYNQGENETQYVNRQLNKLRVFKQKQQVHMFLVAHPRKMPKLATGKFEVPTLMDISGSANFYNKTDMGMSVYRHVEESYVEIHINKVKFKHLGKLGVCYYKYHIDSGRYQESTLVYDEGADAPPTGASLDAKDQNGIPKWDLSNWLLEEEINSQQEIAYYGEYSDIGDMSMNDAVNSFEAEFESLSSEGVEFKTNENENNNEEDACPF
jgi:twinkle protein